VFPKWLRKFLDRGESFTHLPGYVQESRKAPPMPWGNWPEHRSKNTGITVDTVCRSCNHHWMSDLETHASPLLTPMIEGNPRGLTLDQQVLVSRWMTKTAMVWDQLVPPDDRIYTTEECRWAKAKPTPPPDTTVRLGHYIGTEAAFIEAKHESLFREVPADPQVRARPDAHRTVFVIGKLVVEVGVRRPANSLTVTGQDIDVDELLMPIWPSLNARRWPPRLALNDMTLESLHRPDEPD